MFSFPIRSLLKRRWGTLLAARMHAYRVVARHAVWDSSLARSFGNAAVRSFGSGVSTIVPLPLTTPLVAVSRFRSVAAAAAAAPTYLPAS